MKRVGLLCMWVILAFVQVSGQIHFDWAEQADSSHVSAIMGAASDDLGNGYAVGIFKGDAFQFQQLGCDNSSSINPQTYDAFVVKTDSEGTVEWLVPLQGTYDDIPTSFISDGVSRLFIAGHTESQVLKVGNDSLVMPAGHGMDCFLIAMDFDGNVLWMRSWGGTINDEAKDIALDPLGNIVVAATFLSDTVWLGTQYATRKYPSSLDQDVLLFKLDADGQPLWIQSYGSNRFDFCEALAVDGLGNIIVGFSFFGDSLLVEDETTYNPSVPFATAIVAKLDASGHRMWTQVGTANFGAIVEDIEIHGLEDIVALGTLRGWQGGDSLLLGGLKVYAADGDINPFFARFDAVGTIQWLKTGGTENADFLTDMVVDTRGNIVAAFKTQGTEASFDSISIEIPAPLFLDDYALYFVSYAGNGTALSLQCPIHNVYLGDYQSLSPTQDASLILAGSFYAADLMLGKDHLSSGQECAYITKLSLYPSQINPVDSFFQSISVFPNPSSGVFTIRVEASENQTFSFAIYDAIGREIIRRNPLEYGDNTVENLPAGMWNIVIWDSKKRLQHTFKHVTLR